MSDGENGSNGATRERLLDIIVQSIAEVGAERTTYRSVAERARVSIGTVQHYFPEKRLLLREALYHMHRLSLRYRVTDNELQGAAALEARLLAGLPVDEERRALWPFYIEYWAQATRDTAVREAHLGRWNDIANEWKRLLGDQDGLTPADIDDIVSVMVPLQFGLTVQGLINPKYNSADRVSALVHRALYAMLHTPLPPSE